MFVILKPSVADFGRNCVLGSGSTELEAWQDATGQETVQQAQKSFTGKGAWSDEVDDEDFFENYA